MFDAISTIVCWMCKSHQILKRQIKTWFCLDGIKTKLATFFIFTIGGCKSILWLKLLKKRWFKRHFSSSNYDRHIDLLTRHKLSSILSPLQFNLNNLLSIVVSECSFMRTYNCIIDWRHWFECHKRSHLIKLHALFIYLQYLWLLEIDVCSHSAMVKILNRSSIISEWRLWRRFRSLHQPS